PALSEVPGCGVTSVAHRARSRAVAGAVLSRRVHAAEPTARHRLPEQARDLQPADEGGGRDDARHRRRSQAPRRTDRITAVAAHLGSGAPPPPAVPRGSGGGSVSPPCCTAGARRSPIIRTCT